MRFITPFLCLFALSLHSAESIRCACTKDTPISSATVSECDGNGGKSERSKMKIYQEFAIFDFDMSKLKGRSIESATLYLAPAGGEEQGKGRGTDLRWFTISTLSSPWEEGLGTSYTKDEKGKGATFNAASHKTRAWCALTDGKPAFENSRIWDVSLGNGNSIRCDVDAGDPKNGYFAIPLDKRLVEALVSRTAHGLLIMDGSTGVDRNCTVFMRDSRKPPYLVVNAGPADATPPAAVSSFAAKTAPRYAQLDYGAAMMTLQTPDDCFALKIKVDGVELPRWMVPFPNRTGRYTHPKGIAAKPPHVSNMELVVLDFLPPDKDLQIQVSCLDAAGNESAPVSMTTRSSPSGRQAAGTLPASPWSPEGGDAPQLGNLKVWVAPENCKIDPQTGSVLYEDGMEQAARKNSIWNARTKTVRLAAARGDIASFQLVFERGDENPNPAQIDLRTSPSLASRLWHTWFVKVKDVWQAEYALPLQNETMRLSADSAETTVRVPQLYRADNKVERQRFSVVVVDLWTKDLEAKNYATAGTIRLQCGAATLELNLQLRLYDARIPDQLHFSPEFNCYSGPGEAGSAQFFDSHRLAHYHRCAINRVTHSHHGNFQSDVTPPVGKDGSVSDWSAYDRNIGPLLDGSAFAENPRKNIPVSVMYLPLFEGYPLNFKQHYNPGVTAKGKEWKAIHDVYAKPVELCFPDSYPLAFKRCAEDFARHALSKRWTHTRLQCFQNNKHQYARDGWTGTAWMMDEPNEYFDWRALNYYASLFGEGVRRVEPALKNFVYRADVSRPMWQGNCSDGVMDEIYIGGDLFSTGYLSKATRRRAPMRIVAYGGANDQTRSNHETTAWCLKSYIYEADGVVPWQSLGDDSAFDKGDSDFGNALIVDGRKRFNQNAIASYRVHAFRSGAQLCELLRLLEEKRNMSRALSAALIAQKVPLASEFKQSFADDAAAVTFQGLNGDRFVELKESILMLLEK